MAASATPLALVPAVSLTRIGSGRGHQISYQLGFKVPNYISIISFGGKVRRGAIVNCLTSVTVDGTETGRLAGKLIKEMIDGERAIDDTEQFMLNLELYQGETLGRV